MMYGEEIKGCTSNEPDYSVMEKKAEPNMYEILRETEKELLSITELVEKINGLLLGPRDCKGDDRIEVNSMNTNAISNLFIAQEIHRKLELTARTLGA